MDAKQPAPGGTNRSSWDDQQSGKDKKGGTNNHAAPENQTDDAEDETDKQVGNPRSNTENEPHNRM